MPDFFDCMTDLESMGKQRDAAIVSVGAVFFNYKTGELGPTFLRTINLATAVRDGGKIEPGTVIWWLGQSQAARDAIRFGGQDIRKVLQDFRDWIKESCRHEDVKVWGNSDEFDLAKLEGAYERSNIAVPWNWTNARDFRTIRKWYPKVEYNYNDKGDGAHNALADAIFQAEHMMKIQRSLRRA